MKEQLDNAQLELFANSEDAKYIRQAPSNSLLAYIRGFERKVLLIIAIAIISIVAFSLGVERGKKLSSVKNNVRIELATTTSKPANTEAPKEQSYRIPIKKELPLNEPSILAKQNYAIQLASYKTKSIAEKEAENLKRKGFSPLVLTKGDYVVLYVVNFSSKESAQALLTELKKRYRDCYVRRL